MPKHIVRGQPISTEKKIRAQELRHNQTPTEQKLWEHLRTDRLHGLHFRRQQIIAGFIVDFYCHAAAVVVEVDGEVHTAQVEQDRQRDQALQALGLRILRFKNETVESEMEQVLEAIRQACEGRA